MTNFYTDSQRVLQDTFETRRLADAHEANIVHDVFTRQEREFILARDMFFLATVDANGRPTVSYKGGDPGFVGFVGNDLVFPSYDGNGMYLSIGNATANCEVGLLFVDFETPRRLRVQGRATVVTDFDRSAHVGAELLVCVRATEIFVNCPRYIHQYQKVSASPHVPKPGQQQPLATWKRIDSLRQSLSDDDRRRVDEIGSLTFDEHEALVAAKKA